MNLKEMSIEDIEKRVSEIETENASENVATEVIEKSCLKARSVNRLSRGLALNSTLYLGESC